MRRMGRSLRSERKHSRYERCVRRVQANYGKPVGRLRRCEGDSWSVIPDSGEVFGRCAREIVGARFDDGEFRKWNSPSYANHFLHASPGGVRSRIGVYRGMAVSAGEERNEPRKANQAKPSHVESARIVDLAAGSIGSAGAYRAASSAASGVASGVASGAANSARARSGGSRTSGPAATPSNASSALSVNSADRGEHERKGQCRRAAPLTDS